MATLVEGRIKPEDLATIDTVCKAIKTDFNYGVIFNKVDDHIVGKKEKEDILKESLITLSRKPSSFVFINCEEKMEDEENAYMPIGSENRKKLIDFIDSLESNFIPATSVEEIDVTDYEEKVNAMRDELSSLGKNIQGLKESNETLKEKLSTVSGRIKQLKEKEDEKPSDDLNIGLAGLGIAALIISSLIPPASKKDDKK